MRKPREIASHLHFQALEWEREAWSQPDHKIGDLLLELRRTMRQIASQIDNHEGQKESKVK